jgi:hypothetical protein
LPPASPFRIIDASISEGAGRMPLPLDPLVRPSRKRRRILITALVVIAILGIVWRLGGHVDPRIVGEWIEVRQGGAGATLLVWTFQSDGWCEVRTNPTLGGPKYRHQGRYRWRVAGDRLYMNDPIAQGSLKSCLRRLSQLLTGGRAAKEGYLSLLDVKDDAIRYTFFGATQVHELRRYTGGWSVDFSDL